MTCLASCATTTGNKGNDPFPQELNISDNKQKVAYASGYQQMKALLSNNTPLETFAKTSCFHG
jgi:hypothetical protein